MRENGLRKEVLGEAERSSGLDSEGGETLRMESVVGSGCLRRHSGYSSSKRWMMRSRVESRNLSFPIVGS